MAGRITATLLKNLEPGETAWDSDLPGFGARCQRRSVSFVLKTRVNGRIRWFTIGKFGAPWTPDSARRQARVLLGEIARGNDPAREREAHRAATTVNELVDAFLEKHAVPKLKPRTVEEYRSLLDRFVRPAMGDMRVPDVTRREIGAMHDGMRATPRQANHALAATRKMFSWAEAQGYQVPGTNPCRFIEKYPERGRERFLSPGEFERLGSVLASSDESPHAIAAIRLLVLTGARRNEILGMLWSQVDLERGLILLPDSKTGARSLFLSPEAAQVLGQVPRFADNPFVICGQKPGRPLVGLGRIWKRIAAEAALGDVRIHDLRHSFASSAIAEGVPLATIGALLGHKRPDTTARYAHLAASTVKAAGDRVGRTIGAALQARSPGRGEQAVAEITWKNPGGARDR